MCAASSYTRRPGHRRRERARPGPAPSRPHPKCRGSAWWHAPAAERLRTPTSARTDPTSGLSALLCPHTAKEPLALELIEPAPDAVAFLDLDGVVETGLLHLAAAAEGTSGALPKVLLRLALEVARGEEEDCVLSTALRGCAPGGVVVHRGASAGSLWSPGDIRHHLLRSCRVRQSFRRAQPGYPRRP